MIKREQPHPVISGKFGVFRRPDAGIDIETYAKSGELISRTAFDVEAANEFMLAVVDAVSPGSELL